MIRRFRKPRGIPAEGVDELFEVAFGGRWDEAAAARLREDVARAEGMGMRAGVFGKAGDSNLAAYNSLYGLGSREPEWDVHDSLRPTMLRYREIELPAGKGGVGQAPAATERTPWNSFSRASASARSGIISDQILLPSGRFDGADSPTTWRRDPDCPPDEAMLAYEIGLIRPRYVFVNFGTNGASYGMDARETALDAGRVIDEIKRLGPVPVVFTIPVQLDHADAEREGRWEFAKETSEWIRRIAVEARIPLFDQWSVLADERLVNHGMIDYDEGHYDGFHLETPGGFRSRKALQRSVDFRPPALLYGAPLRNLLLLRTLATLDAAIDDGYNSGTGLTNA
ncbi:MAG: SGNH/GDSL hydrolase family protein [Solirubrobacterales bacterium]